MRARLGEGSTCEALKAFFEKHGCSEIAVYPASGAWRHKTFDVMSWEIHMLTGERKHMGKNGIRCYGCWETITEFLRKAKKFGYNIDKDDEIWAHEELPIKEGQASL